jgi:drug/metabolite transporter (DMT)-like permease
MATTPLFAMGIARVFSGETLTPRMVGGGLLAVIGVALLVM